MNPEDVPAELVEKAARARTAAQHGRPLDDAVWSAVRSRIEEVWIASALAAVMPEIQAQALREAADYQGPADEAAHFTPEARNLLRSLAERSAATPEGARFRRLQQAGTEGHRREE